jgi:serine phosphatase RsbU (regulator of sigma subunit)
MAQRFRGFILEVRALLVVLILLVPLLAYAGYDVERRVAASATYQSEIRQAQTLRGALMRSQVDEETGVRGYLETNERAFLEPYTAALGSFPRRSMLLHRILSQYGRDGELGIVEEETHLNFLWLNVVAKPLVAHPSQRNLKLQLAGKGLVDNFRARDEQLTKELTAAANAADSELQRAVIGSIVFSAVLLALFSVGGLVFAYYLSRSARREFENHVLYQNQKRIADSLQNAFLQKSLPMTPGIGLHAMYVPATTEAQVGGDWYDAFTLPDGRLLFSIGDVAGHGLDAAVVMSRARQAIVAAALQESDPARVLARANDAIMLQDSRMVTAICGFINPHTLELTYATAGHPPPILAGPGKPASFLPHEGIPLGIIRGTEYPMFRTVAPRDALIAFYTDGVIEHKRDIFDGERRLLEAVDAAVGRDDPAVTIHEAVFSGTSATDDVAIFTVTFRSLDGKPNAEATVDALQASRLSLPAPSPLQEFSRLSVDRPIRDRRRWAPTGAWRASDTLSKSLSIMPARANAAPSMLSRRRSRFSNASDPLGPSLRRSRSGPAPS